MKKNKTPNVKVMLLLSAIGFAPLAAHATNYTWNTTTTANWASTNWSGTPAVDAATGPVVGDDIFSDLAASHVMRLNGIRQVDTITLRAGAANWTIQGGPTENANTLTANSLSNNGNGPIAFRNGTATAALDMTLGNLTLDGTTAAWLRMGYTAAAESNVNWLHGLTVTGETKVVRGTAAFNVRDGLGGLAYSLGLLNASDGVIYLNHSYVTKNADVAVSGLSGSGGIVHGASTITGGANTGTSSLSVAVTGASYSTGTILSDGSTGGKLTLAKAGNGTQTLSAASTYSGGTTISAGALLVANSAGSATGTGNVLVGASGTLGGNGIIAPGAGNHVTVSGILSPGDNSEAALRFDLSGASKLDFASGSYLKFTLGTVSDSIAFLSAGDWLGGSGNATLDLTLGTGFDYGDTYVIFSNATTAGFTLADVSGYDTVNYTHSFIQSGNDYALSFAPVPEPSTFALLGVAALALLLRQRRQKRA